MNLFKDKLYIMSRRDALNFKYDNRLTYGIVSIRTPFDKAIKFPENCIVHSTAFYDIEKPTELINGHITIPMKEKQGIEIASFIGAFYDYVDKFVVHCDAGISRSAGVVKAILQWKYQEDLPLGDSAAYYAPNYHVYKIVKSWLDRLPINT